MEIKNSLLFIVQFFMGTSYSFKISNTAVYRRSCKTNNDVRMKTIYYLKVTIKVTFPCKKIL